MKRLQIFFDLTLPESALKLLRQGIAPHVLVHPARPAVSVLAEGGLDPALGTAEVAFGQPSVAGVLESSRLRWVQLASAGYTRFDTSGFRSAAQRRGLMLTNSSTVYAGPCAEHVFAFMLAQARQLVPALGRQCASGSPDWDALRSG
jgi:phosphoglycerate dehydrogenase-like enzyme